MVTKAQCDGKEWDKEPDSMKEQGMESRTDGIQTEKGHLVL